MPEASGSARFTAARRAPCFHCWGVLAPVNAGITSLVNARVAPERPPPARRPIGDRDAVERRVFRLERLDVLDQVVGIATEETAGLRQILRYFANLGAHGLPALPCSIASRQTPPVQIDMGLGAPCLCRFSPYSSTGGRVTATNGQIAFLNGSRLIGRPAPDRPARSKPSAQHCGIG
jgi:hypothetical protein